MLLRCAALSLLSCLFACQSPSLAAAAPAGDAKAEPAAAQAPAAGTKADEKADEKAATRKQKEKELRGKERELEAAKAEQRIAELDKSTRQRGIEHALRKTALDVQRAQQDLDVFLRESKPRELEERRMQVDQSTYRAEHAKNEFGELEAMYAADEFAKSTKELVLKRGRRDLEMAERSLAIARRELVQFETVTLPQREAELRQRLADTELERAKADSEAEKAKLEFALAQTKAEQRQSDLVEEIAELRAALAKVTP